MSALAITIEQLDVLALRVERMEAALEGLQDAIYRQAVLHDREMAELRRRMEPPQMARDLSEDARRRGI